MGSDSAVYIILGAIVAAIVFFAILAGRKKKTSSSGTSTSKSTGTLRGTIPVTPTTPPASTPAPKPTGGAAPVPKPDSPGQNSVFSYTANDAVWLCPNCACENSPSSTHCCVCFWDKTVGVR